MTPKPEELVPRGANLDTMFGRLPIAPARKGVPSGSGVAPAKTPGGSKLLELLGSERYFGEEPDARATFSLEGQYGARTDPDNRWHLIIPAGWCATDEPEEIWRCVSLIFRLRLLHGYSRVARPSEPFTVDMREAIVDGLAFFLRIRSVADGQDAEAYELLRERVMTRMAHLHLSSATPHQELYAKYPYACEAYAWLRGGLVFRSLADESSHFLNEQHFAYWLTHDSRRPVASLVGMLSLVERSLYGTSEHLRSFYGVRTVTLGRSAELFKKLPAPWDIPTLLVAEAIDRAVHAEQFVAKSAIMHVEYALAATDGEETLRRLLSSFGDPEAQSNAMALRA